MKERTRRPELLDAVVAIAQVARSLYGPGKARKQVTNDALGVTRFTTDAFEIVQSLSSEHAALAIVNDALEQQMHAHGTVRLHAEVGWLLQWFRIEDAHVSHHHHR